MKRILPVLCLSLSSAAMAVEQSYVDYRLGNYPKALPQLLKQKNDKVALYYLGQLSLQGYAIPKNPKRGIAYIEQSAARGYTPAQLFLGKYYLTNNKPKQAFKWFKWAANTDNVEASLYVASAYLHGYGVDKNPGKARRYIVYAAKQGQAVAQAELAKIFLASKRARSQKLGKIWLSKALKQGNAQAMVLQAKLYLSGRSYEQAPEKAKALLEKAAKKGNVAAYYQLGRLSEQSGEFSGYDDAYRWYNKAARLGDSAAVYRLGKLKLSASPQQGIGLISKAAELGNKKAMHELYVLYKQGKYVEADKKLASKWYRKSKRRYALSKTLNPERATYAWLGDGSVEQAKEVYQVNTSNKHWQQKQALRQGILNASPQMPVIEKNQLFSERLSLTQGKDIDLYSVINTLSKLDTQPVRIKMTFPHYKLDSKHTDLSLFEWQAHHGDSIAQFKLGLAYQYGIGVNKDPVQARAWYIKGVKQKNVRAEYQLGLMYLTGDGVAQNFEKALYWMNKSAFKGNAMSQFVLAVIYDKGYTSEDGLHHIEPDYESAINMYNLAASEGVAKAQIKLAKLYSHLLATHNYSVAKQKKMHGEIHEMYYFAYANGVKEAGLPLAYYTVAKSNKPKDLKWARQVAEKLAAKGNAQASLLLGLINDRGLGVVQNAEKAVMWYQDAAKLNNPVAYFMLGTHYYLGNGVAKNTDKSLSLLAKAAEHGLAYANYNLAAIKQQQGQAFVPYLVKAADKHYAKAELALADHYLLNSQDETMLAQAAGNYTKLAEHGYADAQLKLAYLYQHGIALGKNENKARHWFQKASFQGQAVAQYLLANQYQSGLGGRYSPKRAAYWYKKSADKGFAPAYTALGFHHETIKRNYLAAKHWYQKAAQSGERIGQYDLGLLYLQGKGIPVDGPKAVQWLSKAAEHDNAQAQVLLGLLYLNGKYVSKSPEQAYQLFVKAAKHDDKQAYYQLGLLYETGVGTSLDEKRAMTHYQQAAQLGSEEATYALGRMYDYGVGVRSNKSKAIDFYLKAKNYNVAAQFRLAMLYWGGNGVEQNSAKAKAFFKQAAGNGSYRAQDYYNYLNQFSDKEGAPQLISYVDPIPLKYKLIERESSPNVLFLNALVDLNQGELVQSRKMLHQIRWSFPDFNPAKKTLNNI